MKAKLIINNQEIEVEISEEEYKKLQPEKKTGYERVDEGQAYYHVTSLGGWGYLNDDNQTSDAARYNTANYYSSKEVAENNMRADKLMRQLRRFAVEHRENKFDWGNHKNHKHYICYDHEDAELYSNYNCVIARFGCLYFDSKEAAQAAIDTFRDELIWYFTEYKDSL